MKQITVKQAKKWAKALRSGKYSQTKGRLQRGTSYCCLGVACKIFISEPHIERNEIVGSLPEEQYNSPEWLRDVDDLTREKMGCRLSCLNDEKSYNFDMIADVIELLYVHKALDE